LVTDPHIAACGSVGNSPSALVATASLLWQVYNAIRIDRARVRLVVDPSMVTPGINEPVVVS
jgi:hypothetical protein